VEKYPAISAVKRTWSIDMLHWMQMWITSYNFLDPRFKLSHVKDRAKVLEDMEKQMLK